jgi:hypothetical protein
LADWRFSDAIPELTAGSQLLTAARETDMALSGADAMSGTDEAAFEHAASLADLDAAASNAQALEASAKAVAAAVATSQEPVGLLDGIGLIGIDLAGLRTSAVEAVHAGNSSAALSQAAQLAGDVQQASSNGALRVGSLVVILIVCGGTYLLIRRRRRINLALAAGSTVTADVLQSEPSIEGPALETGFADSNPNVDIAFDSPEQTVANSVPYLPNVDPQPPVPL